MRVALVLFGGFSAVVGTGCVVHGWGGRDTQCLQRCDQETDTCVLEAATAEQVRGCDYYSETCHDECP